LRAAHRKAIKQQPIPMNVWEKPTLGIVGAGKVGCTLARLLSREGYAIGVVYSRTDDDARKLAETVHAQTVGSAGEVATLSDLVLLTVPDDAIVRIVPEFDGIDINGKGFIHTSGAHDAGILASLAERGAMVGNLHPAFPFADVEMAIERLPGTTFAVEAADVRLYGWLMGMIEALHGRALVIPVGKKPLYHAALVLASNYTVTLYALAEALLIGLGAERVTADHALNGLVSATAENLRTQGIPAAMTGPLVRSDISTISAHLHALAQADEQIAALYKQLALLSFPMLAARGIDPEPIEQALNR
jgi:predicted short-subunit dehydrogenase-like oxidoreductase (DUF2520 family)